jgi:Ca-activated chloride channel family protein
MADFFVSRPGPPKPRYSNDFSRMPFCTALAWSLIQNVSVRIAATGTLALTLALLWSAGGGALGQQLPLSGLMLQSPAARPTFRSGVDLVRITAVVHDRRGRPVLGLVPSDFELDASGERVQIVEFGSEATGVSIALLIDDSGSMSLAGRRDAAQEVAKQIIGWLEAGRDEVTLLGFDKRLRTVQPFTTQPSDALAGLAELQPYGLTSLYDAVAEAARPLVDRSRPRRAVVVITDGVDTASVMSAPEVSRVASEIDVPVYVVAIRLGVDRIGGMPDVVSPAAAASSQASLDDLARWTGGATFTAGTPAETGLAAQRILTELRHQYLIAFEASPRAGWHALTVGVRKKDVFVRARGGFMAGTHAGTL